MKEGMKPELWETDEPSADFADRVMRSIEAEHAPVATLPKSRRRGAWTMGAAALAVAAGLALVVQMGKRTNGHGEATALATRDEVRIGERVTAVLEPGAHLTWTGDRLTQDRGNVFYRVERGEPLVVTTPAGLVQVHGTCFRVDVQTKNDNDNDENRADEMNKRDVKAGGVGALTMLLATVAVYEGKVTISHAEQARTLAAGQSATMDANGVHGGAGEDASGAKDKDGKTLAANDESYAEANRNLAESVRDYKSRLEALEATKTDLAQRLADAQHDLAVAGSDGGAVKDEYDPSPSDWADMAKKGAVRFRVPCDEGWTPTAEQLNKLGLSPEDGPALQTAWTHSHDRVWQQIQPLCAQSLGTANAAAVDALGVQVCLQLLGHQSKDEHAALVAVDEVRAGSKPEPGARDQVDPFERALLALTGESAAVRTELTKSLGPDEAARVAAEGNCMSQNSYGSGDDVMR